MWEEVYPNLKFDVPQRRGALHDSENGFLLRFGLEMVNKVWSFDGGFNGEEEEEKSNVRVRESFWILLSEERERGFYEKMISFFLLFYFFKNTCHLSHFEWNRRAHFCSWCDSYSTTRREKNLTFWNAKILPWFAFRFFGSSPSRFSAPVGTRFR